jgi:hypothetical protein
MRCGIDGRPCIMCGAGGMKKMACDPHTGDVEVGVQSKEST